MTTLQRIGHDYENVSRQAIEIGAVGDMNLVSGCCFIFGVYIITYSFTQTCLINLSIQARYNT